MAISSRLMQLKKAEPFMLSNASGKCILLRFEHPAKAEAPMVLQFSGSVIDCKDFFVLPGEVNENDLMGSVLAKYFVSGMYDPVKLELVPSVPEYATISTPDKSSIAILSIEFRIVLKSRASIFPVMTRSVTDVFSSLLNKLVSSPGVQSTVKLVA